MSIELVMLPNHLILCCLLLLPSVFPPPLMHMRNWFTHPSQQLNSSKSQGSLPQVPRKTVGSNSGQCIRCRCLNAAPLRPLRPLQTPQKPPRQEELPLSGLLGPRHRHAPRSHECKFLTDFQGMTPPPADQKIPLSQVSGRFPSMWLWEQNASRMRNIQSGKAWLFCFNWSIIYIP